MDWVIIGQQTPISKKTTPKLEWVEEIVSVADHVSIPVFLKNNLWSLFAQTAEANYKYFWGEITEKGVRLRQEFPK